MSDWSEGDSETTPAIKAHKRRMAAARQVCFAAGYVTVSPMYGRSVQHCGSFCMALVTVVQLFGWPE